MSAEANPGRPRLSIVVPFYDVEKYLATCLDSLANQTMGDFEAILVDDGSRDGSRAIAEDYCRRDPRFTILTQQNQGLGPARNTGIDAARGEFLCFVDSDDLVPARAYDQMLRTIDGSGSDMVCGDARRFNDLGVRPSYVHQTPFATERIGTHVREFAPLALDRMAWNKVVRRSFWDHHGFRFPAMLYEDYPVTIKLHVLAEQVDVLPSPVYYWRERDGGDLSITQRKWELANLRDRADSAAEVLDFVHERAPEIAQVVEQHLLHIDLSAIVAGLFENDEADRVVVQEYADRIHRRTSPEARAAVIPFERIQNDLLSRGRLDELETLVAHRVTQGTSAPLARSGWPRRRHHLQLPFLNDRSVGVPRRLYEVAPEAICADVRLRDAVWTPEGFRLDLLTAIPGIRMAEDSTVRVVIENGDGSDARRVPLTAERYRTHTRPMFPDELAGTRVVVDPAALAVGGSPTPGLWRFAVEVAAGGLIRRMPVHKVDSGRARWAPVIAVDDRTIAHGDHTPKGYALRVRRTPCRVTAVHADDDDLIVTGSTHLAVSDPRPMLRLWVDNGSADVEFVGTITDAPDRDARRFEVRVPATSLIPHAEAGAIEERTPWLVRLVLDGKAHPLAVAPGAGLAHVRVGNRRVSPGSSSHGNLVVHEEYAHPLAETTTWASATSLQVSGIPGGGSQNPAEMVARRYVTPADRVDVPLPLHWTDGRFTTEVDVEELMTRARAVADGREGREATPWEFHLPGAAGLEPLHADTTRLDSLAGPATVQGRVVRPTIGRSARLRVHIE